MNSIRNITIVLFTIVVGVVFVACAPSPTPDHTVLVPPAAKPADEALASASRTTTPTVGITKSALRDRDVVYYNRADQYIELIPKPATLKFYDAFLAGRYDLILQGRRATFSVGERQPVFYSSYSPAEALLLRLRPGDIQDDGNDEVGKGGLFSGNRTGPRKEDQIDVTAEREGNLFRLTPRTTLEPGEYGFVLLDTQTRAGGTNRIFDFGVD